VLYDEELGFPQPPGWPDHTAVSLKSGVLTAVFTVLFCTGSISLSSRGTSAPYGTAQVVPVVVVVPPYAHPAVLVAPATPLPGVAVTTKIP